MPMTQALMTIKQTANFGRNLAAIEVFLTETDAPQAFDALLDGLLNTVIPNLELFPGLGRPFFNRAIGSAEAASAIAALKTKLALTLGSSAASLREYVMAHYLVLYVQVDESIYLMSIKHHRQLSFDFEAHWGAGT
jgi:hypothetical protein